MCQLHSRDQITDRVCTWAYQIEKLHLLFTPRERDGGVSARRWRADTGIGDVILLFWSACLLFPLLLLSWLLSKLYQVPILYTPFLAVVGISRLTWKDAVQILALLAPDKRESCFPPPRAIRHGITMELAIEFSF